MQQMYFAMSNPVLESGSGFSILAAISGLIAFPCTALRRLLISPVV